MKNEDLLNALQFLPDDMIEEAAKGRQGCGKAKITSASRFLKPTLAVASVAVIFGISVFAMSYFGIGIDIGTADEAFPELSPPLEDAAEEDTVSNGIFDMSTNGFPITSPDVTANDKSSATLAPSETYVETSTSDDANTDIKIQGGLSCEVIEEITANIYFSDSSITLENKKGAVISEINLREYLDTARISVGTITLNHSEKNLEKIDALLTVMEKSPVISPSSTAESEAAPMVTLHFYVSDGWELLSDTAHKPVRAALELLSGGYVRITVDGFAPIYISVAEEALTEFTNGLEYIVTND